MSARLSEPLYLALQARLQGVPLRTLQEAYVHLSRDYRLRTVSPGEREDLPPSLPAGRLSGGFTREEGLALAYLAARFPATHAAAQAALARVPDAALDGVASALDLGAGPGTATLALRERHPGLTKATLLDSDRRLLAHAPALAASWPDLAVTLKEGDIGATLHGVPPHDLVLLAFVLSEVEEKDQASFLEAAWTAAEKGLFLLEPGTPEAARRMLKARRQLTGMGGRLVAPCPQAGDCPMETTSHESRVANQPKRWCHFSVRLERRGLHRQVKGADLGYEDEKYCWLFVSKDPTAQVAAPYRLHADPHRRNRHLTLDVCDAQGRRRELFYERRSTHASLRQAARQLRWGDGWDPGAVKLEDTEEGGTEDSL